MSIPSPRIPGRPGTGTGAGTPLPARPEPAASHRPDLRDCERADCCPAKPAVIAVLPATASRGPADLLFCGHHYRQCRQALAAGRTVFLDIVGQPLPEQPWL